MTTTEREVALANALEFIRAQASAGHGLRYIAEGLNRAGLPRPNGRAGCGWHPDRVRDLALEFGIRPWARGAR